MEEQEKVKRIELEQDMSWKMYQILTITACTANLIGTICNFCIHGTKLPTILCGICRMDYEKGANTGGLDHITTCMV